MTSSPESNLPSPDLVLARARAATGGAACDRVRTLRLVGTISIGGLSGPTRHVVDVERGRSTRAFTLGPASYATGFDGTRAWRRDPNGDVTLQDADAGLRAGVTQAWLDARAWCAPTHGAARLESLGVREVDGQAFDAVQALPMGGEAVQLWFDRATHLLSRVVQVVLGRETITRLDDHRAVDGVQLPLRISTGNGDPRFDRVVVADRIDVNEPVAEREFDVPDGASDDVDFVNGGDRASIDVAVIQNTVVVPVSVDGHALRFVLDSGGVTLVTAEAAARLGLRAEGRLEAGGVDERPVTAGFVRVRRLAIGDAAVLDVRLMRVLSMPDASAVLGAQVDGILGVELFRRLVVRIDYERQRLHLLRRPAPPAADWGRRLPLTFFVHIPCVTATLDGETGQFWLDTGNSGAVLLHARPGAPPPAGASAVTTIGWGVGGAIRGRLARARRLELGDITIDAPALRVLEDGERALSTPGLAGNIGAAVLSRFVVTFDHAQAAVWLAPNASFGAPFDIDRSGLRIHAGARGFDIVAVMAGSPADEAGLRVGDVVVAVDGVPATDIPLHAQRRAWQASPAGTRVDVRVERAGDDIDAAFTLRDLAPAA